MEEESELRNDRMVFAARVILYLSISDGAQSHCEPLLRRVCFLEILITLLKKMGRIYRIVGHEDDCEDESELHELGIFYNTFGGFYLSTSE